ncbi:hypothetical protein BD779DRAFT_1795755 [Infundibulicybe gibba]|nr:hypothetical protein BD779DRAFT_1795755 [Infundibulicybe gibba]
MSSSLSSVVSNLVRASMGSSVSNTVTDSDLDRHVAELILKEAKKKAERYGEHGIRAYLPTNGMSDSNAPRTNKRFLSNIIRSTDDHNKTILRAQAQAAQEVKREEKSKKGGREEPGQKRQLRQKGSGGLVTGGHGEARMNAGTDGTEKPPIGHESARNGRATRKKRTMTRILGGPGVEGLLRDHAQESIEKIRMTSGPTLMKPVLHLDDTKVIGHRGELTHMADTKVVDAIRRSAMGVQNTRGHLHILPPITLAVAPPLEIVFRLKALPDTDATIIATIIALIGHDDPPARYLPNSGFHSSSKKRLRSPSPDETYSKRASPFEPHQDDDKPTPPALPERVLSSKRHKAGSSSATANTQTMSCSPSRSPTPGPDPAVQLPSKMDKYFEESYDPRLDVAPLAAPKVPATGLINNAEFEGWDAMLELIKIRREDKEEKKRMERLGLTSEKLKDRKPGTSSGVSDRWGGEGVSIMEIEYKKRGSVREWDLGKEGF